MTTTAIPQPFPSPSPAPSPQPPAAPALFPEPAPAARKPSRFEKAVADARAAVDYEPEWFWRIHKLTPANQLGPAVQSARQDGLDYDQAAAEESLRGANLSGAFQAVLAHEGRDMPIFRRPAFTIEAPPAPAPVPVTTAAGINPDKIAAYITAGAAALATLRDLFAPRDALTVKDLIPLFQKQQERTPVAELIEGIEAIRRVSGAEPAGESGGELAEVIRAAAPAVIEAMTRRPAPPPQQRRPIQQQQRPALTQPTHTAPAQGAAPQPAAESAAAGSTPPDLAADLRAQFAAASPIAQAIGFGALNNLNPEAIAPAVFDLIRAAVDVDEDTTAADLADCDGEKLAREWCAAAPVLALTGDYTAAVAAAVVELAGDIRDDEAEDNKPDCQYCGAALYTDGTCSDNCGRSARPGIDTPGEVDDDGNPRAGNPHTAPRVTIGLDPNGPTITRDDAGDFAPIPGSDGMAFERVRPAPAPTVAVPIVHPTDPAPVAPAAAPEKRRTRKPKKAAPAAE